MTTRPDLVVQAARLPFDDYRSNRALNAIGQEAKSAAGAWDKAKWGTTIHSLTERVDGGDLDPSTLGPPWGAMVRAYVLSLQTHGVSILPEFIENTVVVKQYKVAGTYDRIVRMPNDELWVADLKTGRDLGYSWGDRHPARPVRQRRRDVRLRHPDVSGDADVNRSRGLIIHPGGRQRVLYEVGPRLEGGRAVRQGPELAGLRRRRRA